MLRFSSLRFILLLSMLSAPLNGVAGEVNAALVITPRAGHSMEAVRQAVEQDAPESLRKALGIDLPKDNQGLNTLVYRWHGQPMLEGKPFVVCIYQTEFLPAPGSNPLVLVLLDEELKVVSWGPFTCEPEFGFASFITPMSSPHRFLITTNPAFRAGGELWFQLYLVKPTGFTLLDEGYDSLKLARIAKSYGQTNE